MSTTNIAPTEIDKYYRYSEIQGYVHDMTAAMFGGISGHAGLFGNSINVAKLMQMYLQDGNYGGNQIIKKGTMNLFNQCYFCEEGNRRGVTSEFNLSPPPHLHNILNFPPNAHLPGSTPAPPRTHSRDMPVLVTPELGKSFDSSGVSPSPAATPCRPPRIPPPPSKKKPQINNWTPIDPQSKTKSKPSPALDKQLLEQ